MNHPTPLRKPRYLDLITAALGSAARLWVFFALLEFVRVWPISFKVLRISRHLTGISNPVACFFMEIGALFVVILACFSFTLIVSRGRRPELTPPVPTFNNIYWLALGLEAFSLLYTPLRLSLIVTDPTLRRVIPPILLADKWWRLHVFVFYKPFVYFMVPLLGAVLWRFWSCYSWYAFKRLELKIKAFLKSPIPRRSNTGTVATATLPPKRIISLPPERRCSSVVGQEDAKRELWTILDPVAAGVKPRSERPHAVFLFVGPSGVGKTEMAKGIAETFYGNRDAVIRVNMNEAKTEEALWTLLGTPRGYVDSEKGGTLTNALKSNPNQVLLLDEIEKGHPKLLETFMTAFDEGKLQPRRDASPVSLSNTIVVMTSNILSDRWKDLAGLSQEEIKGFIRNHGGFKDELLGRVDRVIVFRGLSDKELKIIARRRLDVAMRGITAMGWKVVFGDDLAEFVLHHADATHHGVRSLDQAIASRVTGPLVRKIHEKMGTRRMGTKTLYVWPTDEGMEIGTEKRVFDERIPWKPVPRHLVVASRKNLLRERIVGQDKALDFIEKRVLSVARGLVSRKDRPALSLLFIGPSGVGKTETAKAIAEMVFGDAGAMTRIDLGQFSMPGSEYRLFQHGGKPGLLTGPVSAMPRCVVLLDEADKACAGVWDAIMTLVDEGYVTEPETGAKISFRETVVILTANPPLNLMKVVFHVDDEEKVREIIGREGMFRMEFLGRLDAVAPFGLLGSEALGFLVKRGLDRLALRVKEKTGRHLTWDRKVVDLLAERAANSPFGARRVQALVDEVAATVVVEALEEDSGNKEIRLVVEDGRVCAAA